MLPDRHQVRLVGSPLDDHIIAALKAGKDHPTQKRSFADVATPYYLSELQEALQWAEVILAGFSRFGVDWFTKNILPVLPKGALVVSITKGMLLTEADTLESFPHHFGAKHPGLDFVAVGGPCIGSR